MRNNKKIFISLLIASVLYGGYYFGIPAILNRPDSVDFLKSYIKKEYGFETLIKNPKVKMGYLPAVWVKADNFAILNNDGSEALSFEGVKTRIRLLPLVLNKAELSHFSADLLNVNLIFDKNSCLKLGQYPILGMSKSKVTLNKAVLNLKKYSINLKDETVNKNIVLNGQDFVLYDFTNNERVKFTTKSGLLVGDKSALIDADIDVKLPIEKITEDKIFVNGKIENLNLADFSTYAKYLSGNKIEKLTGIVNLDVATVQNQDGHKNITGKISIDNLGLMQKDIASSIYCKDKIDINTSLNIVKNGILINELKILSKGIDSYITGSVLKLNTKKPQTDLKISLNKSRMESLIPLLPGEESLVPDVNLYKLKKYPYYGDILGNLEVKGNIQAPYVTGNILSTEGYLIEPISGETPKATVKLQFKGTKAALDATVPASKSQTVFVNGDVNLYNERSADLKITSTKNVDLKTAQKVLNPLHEILKFDLGPVPIMDIRGKGNIDLHVVGTVKDPHVWGVFNFENTSASFLDIHNMTLTDGKGSLTFEDQNTHFKTDTALLYGQPVSIDGNCTLLGVLNYNVAGLNQNSANLLKIIKTSPMLKDIQLLLPPISESNGLTNVQLNLTGQVKDVNDVVFNKNIFAKGRVEFIENIVKIAGISPVFSRVNGYVNFENLNADFKISSNVGNSNLRSFGALKDNILNISVLSDKFILADGARLVQKNNKKIPFLKDFSTISTSFIADYKGPADIIDIGKLDVKGKIYPNKGSKSSIITEGGSFTLKNSHLKLSPLQGTFRKNPYILTADITNVMNKKQDINGYFSMSNFDLAALYNLRAMDIFPPNINPDDFQGMKGIMDITARMRHNNLSCFTKLDDTEFIYVPKHLKVKFNSGNVLIRNNVLALNKINAFVGEMPVFVDGKVLNFYTNPDVDLYVNAKPTQEFFDQFFNNKAVYPIKIKGDLNMTSKLSGTQNKLHAKSEVKIEENSNIYFMGATIGDAANAVELYFDGIYTPSGIKVNDFKYDRVIASQNNKKFSNTQLKSNGTVEFLANNNVRFKDFRVKTENPTDAKIFNIIFRKPFMKQGIFTSDLLINGTAFAPKIYGKLDINSIDIPFFDSKINDISLDFKPDKINIKSKGVVLTNRVDLTAEMKNNLTPPYRVDNIKVKLNELNINKITDAIRDYESDIYHSKLSTVPAESFDLSQIIIKNAQINADNVKIKNINAEDFSTNLSLNEKMLLDIKDFGFKLAEGLVTGSIKYDFPTGKARMLMHMKDANAQIMAETLFDLHNQVFGSVTGDVELNCNAKTAESCTNTLAGNASFNIANGKMPKLGSLEYLLKAGNLLKGGLAGLSINSIVDLITPLKTGEFDSINGNMTILNGIAQSINVYSSGKDLNMYLSGTYNISNANADMDVYGTLSNNITSVFGKLKNMSLNTLLNTIPGVNRNELDPMEMDGINKIPNIENQNIYRIFQAEIFGNIDGNNYVRSFKWIK